MKRLLFIPICFLAAYASAAPYSSLPSADRLNVDISHLGANKVLWEKLWDSPKAFASLLERVESGDKAWLNIAVKLREVSDAGASEMLEASLSVALAKQPANVLAILSNGTKPGTFNVEDICSDGMLAIDKSDQEIAEWRKSAILAVSKVKLSALKHIRKECLKNLSQGK